MPVIFETLSEDHEHELHRLMRAYWTEAERCEQSKAYLAGCVMIGSGLEAMLMLMVNAHPEDAGATGAIPMRGGKAVPLIDWNLGQLLKVAKAAEWLPSGLELHDNWNTRRATVGDYAEASREIRNLVHAGNYLKSHFRRRVTAKYLQQQFDVALACRDWLAAHNNKRLLEHLSEE